MKRITFKTLMKKIAEGQVEVVAWSGDYAHVIFYRGNGAKKREIVEVINVPVQFTR
jgi:hypothetical protein